MSSLIQTATIKTTATVLGGIFVCCLLYKRHVNVKKQKQTLQICEVLFFPDSNTFCYNHFFLFSGCGLRNCKRGHDTTNTSKICEHLLSATTSIDICMFILTNTDIMKSVREASGRKGVKVRILLDKKMAEGHENVHNELKKLGVTILLAETRFILHHKFGILDNKMVINGSYNWTAQASIGNYDNCIITNKPVLVEPFITEFERLWTLFSTPVDRNAPLPEKFRKNPRIRNSAWDGIYVNNETPNVPH